MKNGRKRIPNYLRYDAIAKFAETSRGKQIGRDQMCRAVHLVDLAYIFNDVDDKKWKLFDMIDRKLDEIAEALIKARNGRAIDYETALDYALETRGGRRGGAQ